MTSFTLSPVPLVPPVNSGKAARRRPQEKGRPAGSPVTWSRGLSVVAKQYRFRRQGNGNRHGRRQEPGNSSHSTGGHQGSKGGDDGARVRDEVHKPETLDFDVEKLARSAGEEAQRAYQTGMSAANLAWEGANELGEDLTRPFLEPHEQQQLTQRQRRRRAQAADRSSKNAHARDRRMGSSDLGRRSRVKRSTAQPEDMRRPTAFYNGFSSGDRGMASSSPRKAKSDPRTQGNGGWGPPASDDGVIERVDEMFHGSGDDLFDQSLEHVRRSKVWLWKKTYQLSCSLVRWFDMPINPQLVAQGVRLVAVAAFLWVLQSLLSLVQMACMLGLAAVILVALANRTEGPSRYPRDEPPQQDWGRSYPG